MYDVSFSAVALFVLTHTVAIYTFTCKGNRPFQLRHKECNRGYASPRPLEVTGFDGERGVNRDVQLYANGVFD